MKASFGSRLAAYIIDFFIISILVTIICYAVPTNDNTNETKLNEIANKLATGEINSSQYLEEYRNLVYQNNKNNIVQNTVNITLVIAYFVIFQYMNKGQTLGKKLLHIKVVDENSNQPINIGRGLLRSLVILNIISSIIAIAFISIDKKTYMNLYLTFMEIESLLLLISTIFVLYRKDGRGLHDMIAKTKVIKEGS